MNDKHLIKLIFARKNLKQITSTIAITSTNEQWLINLSDTKIPEKGKIILQLGQQFNLPNNVISKEKSVLEFIKHVEYNLFRADDEICKSVRNEIIQILKSINNCDIKSSENNIIREGVREVKRFISENPDILDVIIEQLDRILLLSHPKF